ncbi:MAG: acyl-CoA/acyl-ACP dehydrogenase [Thermoflavifilum sp.]|nr:acyl-CoA/acyl-ACP dehydrogenase [Thermoflavifilum sp.]MCL6514252.1 acyl-CoA/acyl-ACP dehydrogenase [Alicyclobacillus sp.]
MSGSVWRLGCSRWNPGRRWRRCLKDCGEGGSKVADPALVEELRNGVRKICSRFPGSYWRDLDARRAYPEEFVDELTKAGYLAALIPEEYGGAGLGVTEASVILEEINRSGGNAGACHAQMYTMGVILRHGSEEQKRRYLPEIAAGRLRLQAFGVTEPTTGSDTTQLKTTAVRKGDRYIVNGQKVFISRTEHSDLMVLLVRTTPLSEVKKRTEGLSVLLVDLREAVGKGLTIRPIRTMMNHSTTELFFEDLEVPAENLIGEEGKGFRYILDGMNAERILIAAECIGDGRWFIDKAVRYAKERVVFGRPIGQNQGVQFPIARAHVQVEAADLMRFRAAELYDAGLPCGAEANMAKLLAADASWEAANVALQTHGGFGFAEEFDVERKFRETRLYQVAPISTNLILSYVAEHVLGLPRSY